MALRFQNSLIAVSNSSTHDSQCALSLIGTARESAKALSCKVKGVIADTGYDTDEIFKYSGKRGIELVIEVRRLAVITGREFLFCVWVGDMGIFWMVLGFLSDKA